jgi:dolichol kinase
MRRELYRQAIHFFAGNIMLAIVIAFGTEFALAITIIALILGFAFSKQLIKHAKHPLKEIVELVEREKESHLPGKGAFLLFFGIALTLFLFNNKTIAIAAIIALTYGDSASTIVGKHFGKLKSFGERTIEGSIAGLAITFAFSALFLQPSLAMIAAITAMLAEYLPIDDNLSIPLLTATVLSFLI